GPVRGAAAGARRLAPARPVPPGRRLDLDESKLRTHVFSIAPGYDRYSAADRRGLVPRTSARRDRFPALPADEVAPDRAGQRETEAHRAARGPLAATDELVTDRRGAECPVDHLHVVAALEREREGVF